MQKQKNLPILFLLLLILLQLGFTTYLFATQREGFHSDEIFSYGLANSYYQPYMGIPGDAEDLGAAYFTQYADGRIHLDLERTGYIDTYQWIPGSKYLDYLTVQPNQRFAYDSVIYNQRLDLHPPVYYILLHTICSLFPNTFSIWYAYAISILSLIGTQIFIYLTALQVSRSQITALFCCGLYGLGSGALNTFLFLRQYSLQTMLCMILTYLAIDIYYKENSDFKKYLWPLLLAIPAAYLAFMTHLFSLVYIGIFTAFYCLNLLFKKQWKKMFCFGFGMLIALGGFLLSWSHIFFQTQSYEHVYGGVFSPLIQFKMFLRLFCRYCLGFSIYVLRTPFWNIVLPPIGILCILIPMLLLPFRDEVWCQNIFRGIKNFPRTVLCFIKNTDFITLVISLGALSLFIVSAYSVDIVHMNDFGIRYIMPGLPLLCMVVTIWICHILQHVPYIQKFWKPLAGFLVCIAIMRTHLITSPLFLIHNFGTTTETSQLLKDKNVLVIYDHFNETFRFSNWAAPQLLYTKNDFLVSADLLGYYLEDINQLDEPIDYVLVIYTAFAPNEENLEYADKLCEEYNTSPFIAHSALEYYKIDGDFSEEQYDELVLPLLASDTPDESQADAPVSPDLYPPDCSAVIQSLNGGCSYKLLSGIDVQGYLFYVLELEK